MKKFLIIMSAVVGLVGSSAVMAQQGDDDRPCPGHRPPPPEALDACKGLKAGATCSFEDPEGNEVAGKCFTPEASKPLACRPDQPPKGERRGPPEGGRRSQPDFDLGE